MRKKKHIEQKIWGKESDRINRYKNKVNPKIANHITNIIKPYWDLIDRSSDYYKLRAIAAAADRMKFEVKENVERLLVVFKYAIRCKIEKRIDQLYGSDKTKNYNIKNIRQFLKKHRIDNVYYSVIFNAIYGNMLINLSLEDFKLITNNARKAKFYSAEICGFGSDDVDKLMKPKLRGMNNAILILTGNKETTFDELDYVWTCALKYLPKNGKTSFAYKIGDVDELQLNLMVVK